MTDQEITDAESGARTGSDRRATADGPDPGTPEGPERGADDRGGTDGGPPRPPGQGRRRRRGSRGGRSRRSGAAGAEGRGRSGSEDWSDPAADRGLTAEDLAADAREEAGLPTPAPPRIGDRRPAPAKPKIGDTRPAPPAPSASDESDSGAPKARRRRRRGGRNRSRGSGSGSGAASGNAPGNRTGAAGGPSRGSGRGREPGPGYVDAGADLGGTDLDGTAILDALDEETLERRRGHTRKGRPAGRYLMVVHVHDDGMSQVSVLEGRHLVEHYVSRPSDDDVSIDGNIYLGRVQNVLPGMEAAFVDIGTPKNAVLYRSDVAYDAADFDGERPRIERVLRNGQALVAQVTKNPIGHKGARLTQEVSLAGRFVVMVPGQAKTYGISKRLPDDERKRLRRILDRLKPEDAGLIVRTAAEGATEEELERDLARLRQQWQQIEAHAARAKPGSLLYKEPALAVRIIREEFTKEYRGIVIDDRALFDEVRAYLEAVAPELADRAEYYDATAEGLPVFERFHVHEQLHKALDRKVWLPSGGSLIIEHTEALTVIDVNTGKNVGKSNLEETVFRNNLEAAEAIARELRLRDIGGIIVIDFVDMEDEGNRRSVENAFRDALARDKTRTQMFPISELGLVEMTRKRISEGLVDSFAHSCEHCVGRGFVVDEAMIGEP